jgi:hypothetical protein
MVVYAIYSTEEDIQLKPGWSVSTAVHCGETMDKEGLRGYVAVNVSTFSYKNQEERHPRSFPYYLSDSGLSI